MIVTAHIDTSTPAGKEILHKLENKKEVKIEYPLPECIIGQDLHTENEVFENASKILNDHYGTDYKI